MPSVPIDLDKGGRTPQAIRTYLGPTVGYKQTDAPTNIEYVIGGTGEPIPVAYYAGLLSPDWLIINNWWLASPNVGSIEVDVWLLSQAAYNSGTLPSAANSICNGNYMRLTAQAAASGDPIGWDTRNGPSVPLTQINQNDFVMFNVRAVAGITLLTLVLQCVRTIGPS